MTAPQLAHAAPIALAALLAGSVAGLAYFALLRRSVGLLVGEGGGLAVVALTLGRLAGVAAFLAIAVKFGAMPLVVSFLGFLAARMVTVHRARRTG